jgi:putative sterol carrier protein
MRMNLNVTDVPFGAGSMEAHLDTSAGALELELGHITPVDLTVTLDYGTAKAILVEGNPAAGMQAFMAGRIKVDGDMSKLMALQGAAPDPTAAEVANRLREITE